jgi:K+-transporting ATPase ATPase C chain
MKQHILPAIRITIVSLLLFVVVYSLIILAFAQISPNKGKGEIVSVNGKVVGYVLEGQNFTQDKYFWGRPSAVGYNAAGSGGSNKGPSNAEYLKQVQDRIDTFLVHNPGTSKSNLPAELVTASGSGLDPNISPDGALVQVRRIAAARKLDEGMIQNLINEQTQKPFLGLFGMTTVNLLKLNIALDILK